MCLHEKKMCIVFTQDTGTFDFQICVKENSLLIAMEQSQGVFYSCPLSDVEAPTYMHQDVHLNILPSQLSLFTKLTHNASRGMDYERQLCCRMSSNSRLLHLNTDYNNLSCARQLFTIMSMRKYHVVIYM